jgi:hypothetical protein
LEENTLSTKSLTNSEYFFDDKTTEVSNSEMLMTGNEDDAEVAAQIEKITHSIQDIINR